MNWIHVSSCPAIVIGTTNPRFEDLPSICSCGMPSFAELELMRETVESYWTHRVERGDQAYIEREPPPANPPARDATEGRFPPRLKVVK